MINYSFTLKLNLDNAWKLLHRLGLCSRIKVSNEAFNKEKQNNKFLHLGAQTDGRWKYFGVREIQNPSSRARRGFPKIFFENIWKNMLEILHVQEIQSPPSWARSDFLLILLTNKKGLALQSSLQTFM